jgi:hypothetical protein
MQEVNKYNYQQEHDRKLAQSVCVSAVVKVTAFDPAKMTVDVQPLSKHLENGNFESQPQILKVPIAVTRCGGFIFRPWYKVGDVGTVVYLDHDMDSTVAGGKEAEPLTERNHAASDAVFIGGIVSGSYTVKGLPDESIVLATEDGSTYLAVLQDEIKAVAPSKINATVGGTSAELTPDSVTMTTQDVVINAGGSVTVTAGGNITMNAPAINLN